jgi:hypothetical protein
MKNYKFWGGLKLHDDTPAIKVKPTITQHLLRQVLATKVTKQVEKEAQVQHVNFESPYGKLGHAYSKFINGKVLGVSRSLEDLKPKVPFKNQKLNSRMEK